MTQLITKERWSDYVKESENTPGFVEYLEATEQITERIEKILNAGKNFSELKSELVAFVEDRRSFARHAEMNFS